MQLMLDQAIQRLLQWVEHHDYKGYEPSDGNLSPLHVLTFKLPLLERILQQVVWKSPVDLRRLLAVPMHRSTKGTGYMAWGYVVMFRSTGEARYRGRAESCFDWLLTHSSPRCAQVGWGDSFPFSSRGGRREAFEPTIVWSSLIGQALLDGYEAFGHKQYLDAVAGVCDWIKQLPRNETRTGLCLGYTALGQSTIHNSNMLGAALLARWGRIARDAEALDLAHAAMAFSCTRQAKDGAWAYGEGDKWTWIDSFHTGYNLESLRIYLDATGDTAFAQHLERGQCFFADKFFEPDGRPRYYHDRTFPIDIQSCSQAIETLARFSDCEPRLLGMARRTAAWTLTHMQDADGHFYYRDLGWKHLKTPMMHWGQATMFKALAYLRQVESGMREAEPHHA